MLQNYKNRLQAQGIYLDFLDEPVDSVRRKREGTYASYIFGSGGKRVKVSTISIDHSSTITTIKELKILPI